jgi:hypothetical protein
MPGSVASGTPYIYLFHNKINKILNSGNVCNCSVWNFYQPIHSPKPEDPQTQNNNSGVNIVSLVKGQVGMQVLTAVDINTAFFSERSRVGWCIGTKVSKALAAGVFRVGCSVASEEFVDIKSY